MTAILALAWHITHHDVERFSRLHPIMSEIYAGISIITPPHSDRSLNAKIAAFPNVKLLGSQAQYENRRWLTLKQALNFKQASVVHYCDGDHAMARMAEDWNDWKASLEATQNVDCLVIGRSQAVMDNYPQSLRDTEHIVNLVGSYLLGQNVDLGAGARGFSRRAVEYLIAHASYNTHAIATDAEWPLLLQRAGFRIGTYWSNSALYEIVDDRHRQHLDSADQWAKRVELARLTIETAIRCV